MSLGPDIAAEANLNFCLTPAIMEAGMARVCDRQDDK